MTNPATTSLLDRANLDRDQVRNEVARGLAGADDGELFLEYSQTEALMFDNGRLKQATYDTSQGFGLRAVKDDAVGYAHSSDVSLPALIRAADAVAAVRGGYSGSFAAPPAHTNVRLYGDDNPLDAPGFETKVKLLAEIDAYLRDKDPRGATGQRQPGSDLAGGRDPAARRRELSRHPPAGASQHLRRGRPG
ncbi:putative Zn-dependent protease [Bradyrhizobium sp. USDA 4474]